MTLTLSAETRKALLAQKDQRQYQRVTLSLLGRYMLPNRTEFPCRTVDISPGDLTLLAPVKGNVDDRIIVYLEQLGRIEGRLTRKVDDGFCMTIATIPRKRDKIADQLTWLINRHALGLPEDRRHERIVPRVQRTLLTIEDGREYVVRIIDVSRSGAAVSTDLKPAKGSDIILGHTRGKIVRVFDSGIAIEFMNSIPDELFDSDIVL